MNDKTEEQPGPEVPETEAVADEGEASRVAANDNAGPEAKPCAPDDGAEAASPGEAEPSLEALGAEVAETKDRLLRSLAEIENLRRRNARDLEDSRRYAVSGFARELLDVADNLARAIGSMPDEARKDNELVERFVEGVEMTERSLLAVFERHRIAKVVPEPGEKFDHNRHQAMFELPTDAYPPGTVAEVMQPGYVIADRLLRPAMVGVAKALPKPETPQPTEADEAAAKGQHIDTTA